MKKRFAIRSMLSVLTATSMFLSTNISGAYVRAEDTSGYEFDDPGAGTTLSELTDKYGTDLSEKTIILSTNDIHGAIQDYAYIAALKKHFQDMNATVFLVDSGDFSSDKTEKDHVKVDAEKKKVGYLYDNNGLDVVDLMQAAGYDLATWGNHEFNNKPEIFNAFVNKFNEYKDKEGLTLINSNILKKGTKGNNPENAFTPHIIKEVSKNGDTLRIGFFGLDTKEAANTKAGKNYDFLTGQDLVDCAQKEMDYLKGLDGGENKDNPADIVVCLSHIGLESQYAATQERSADIWSKVTINPDDQDNPIHGIDLMLDGHSHTAINGGADGAPILSTGIWGKYVGITVIDNHDKKIDGTYLIHEDNYWQLPISDDNPQTVSDVEKVQEMIDTITKTYTQHLSSGNVFSFGSKNNKNKKSSDNNASSSTSNASSTSSVSGTSSSDYYRRYGMTG